MGLTIFYSGKIRDIALLPLMTEEVTDICDNLRWICQPIHPYPEIPLQGFQFHAKGSEPIWMTFRKDGRLADPVYYIFKDDTFVPPPPQDEFWLSSVTQFAGMDAHMALITLMRYLSQKYFEDFHLVDEGEYWETNDPDICKGRFDMYTDWMNEFSQKLDTLDGRIGESGETFSERIAELLRTKGWEEILKAF